MNFLYARVVADSAATGVMASSGSAGPKLIATRIDAAAVMMASGPAGPISGTRSARLCNRPGTTMHPLDCYCLAELSATPTGDCRIRLIRSGLRQGEANELANALRLASGRVLLIGTTEARGMTPVLPFDVGLSNARMPQGSTFRRLRQWLDWLRGAGVIGFGALSAGSPEQAIAPRYLADPVIQDLLGIVLAPPCPEWVRSDFQEDWNASVPATSIAGLLQDTPYRIALLDWASHLDDWDRARLSVPLYVMTRPDDPTSAGARLGVLVWQSADRITVFTCGEALRLIVDPEGRLRCESVPLARSGVGWDVLGSALPGPERDIAYARRDDVELASMLDHIPALAKKVLAGLPIPPAWLHHGRQAPEVEGMTTALALRIERDLDDIRQAIRSEVYPFDGSAFSVDHARFLEAEGDPLRRLRRRDVACLFPLLSLESSRGHLPGTTRAVDDGNQLRHALATDVGCPIWVSKRLIKAEMAATHLDTTRIPGVRELAQIHAALGPRAPMPSDEDLRRLMALLTIVPGDGPSLGWQRHCLIRTIGRESEVIGWFSTWASLADRDALDLVFTLRDWWDTAMDNLSDLHSRLSGTATPDGPLLAAAFRAWFKDTGLRESIELSARWHAFVRSEGDELRPLRRQAADPSAKAELLFGPHSLIASRVEARVLASLEDLVGEAQDMEHCVASFHPDVARYTLLIVSLHCPRSGQRATAAWRPLTDGTWRLQEAKAARNAIIDPGSAMRVAIEELRSLLDAGYRQMDSVALAKYRANGASGKNPQSYFEVGVALIRRLPDALARHAERCFPGNGPLESRMRRVLLRAAHEAARPSIIHPHPSTRAHKR